MTVNEHILKVTGSASLPESVELDKNYTIKVEADVVSRSEEKNDDGTMNVVYKAKLITAEVTDNNGNVLKSKDKRKLSQQLRSAMWYEHSTHEDAMEFDSYYNQKMGKLINNWDDVSAFLETLD